MFTRYRDFFFLMCVVYIFPASLSFELYTEKLVRIERGRNVSLPCTFSYSEGIVTAVYWYKHTSTRSPDNEATLIAREFFGSADSLPGFERFVITDDHSLIIGNISIADETTYSCLVVIQGLDKRGYTDLEVIALADPPRPTIEACDITTPGRCTFNVPEDQPESITLISGLFNIRPLANLTWMRSDGKLQETAGPLVNEKDGLYTISSKLQVPTYNFRYEYTCRAQGEAVKGTSSTTVTFRVETGSKSQGVKPYVVHYLIPSIAIGTVITVMAFLFIRCEAYKRFRFPWRLPAEAAQSSRQSRVNNVESYPLNEEQVQGRQKERTLSQQVEELKKKIDRYEEEKRKMECDLLSKTNRIQELELWKLRQSIGTDQTNLPPSVESSHITVSRLSEVEGQQNGRTLSQQVEELKKKITSYGEEKRELEFDLLSKTNRIKELELWKLRQSIGTDQTNLSPSVELSSKIVYRLFEALLWILTTKSQNKMSKEELMTPILPHRNRKQGNKESVNNSKMDLRRRSIRQQ